MPAFPFLVGTLNAPYIYTLMFTPLSTPSQTNGDVGEHEGSRRITPKAHLHILHRSRAVGPHSWLHLSSDNKKNLYASAWTDPPTLAAYRIKAPDDIRHINSVGLMSRSGYVTASTQCVYSAGGGTGEVFAIDRETGGFAQSSSTPTSNPAGEIEPLQRLSFVANQTKQKDDGSTLDFGGLRHGAHSADLSPDGRALYIADIGRNCIFTYSVDRDGDGSVELGEKVIAPRPNDGPRHTWPHPNGRYLYSLQEHSCMVDVFEVTPGLEGSGTKLKHVQGVRAIPKAEDEREYWADEVRTSLSDGKEPKYLYASTRGLKKEKKGWLAAYRLRADGRVEGDGDGDGQRCEVLDMWQTPTSGGWANAIQPGPTVDGIEYLALTDTDEGFVMVISWAGSRFSEVARVKLDEGIGAATAVWL